jgi:dTMP kinase
MKESLNNDSAQKLKLQLKGRFIVIEGTDGSGKGTQIQLLKEKLESNNVPVKVVDFPRYEENIYGRLVGRYLKGEFGGIENVSPYLASLTYAGDRMLAKDLMWNWLNKGGLIIANRYVISSKIFMSARLPVEERQKYLDWEDELEYKTNGIPKEELVIFLHVSSKLSQKNLKGKGARSYMGGNKKDIHEKDIKYQEAVRQVYLEFARTQPDWAFIECTENNQMKSKEDIHQNILQVLVERGILNG